jgi:hypothetical protein
MIDKLAADRRAKLGERIGRLADEDMISFDGAIVVFL